MSLCIASLLSEFCRQRGQTNILDTEDSMVKSEGSIFSCSDSLIFLVCLPFHIYEASLKNSLGTPKKWSSHSYLSGCAGGEQGYKSIVRLLETISGLTA